MSVFTLVTHAPTCQDKMANAAWAKAIEKASHQVPVLIWHAQAMDTSALNHPTHAKAIHNQVKNPLWHEGVLRSHWAHLAEETCQQRLIHLQAVGLLHDAAISNRFNTECFVWLSPEWLSSLGLLADGLIGRLQRLITRTQTCIYSRARGSNDLSEPNDRTHDLDVLITPRDTLSKVNAHYWHHFGQQIEHDQRPSPQGLLRQASIDLEGLMAWFALDADGIPACLLNSSAGSKVPIHTHQVLRRG